MRLRHVFIAIVSIVVAVTSVTSLVGLGESPDEPAEVIVPVQVHEFVLETPSWLDARAGEPVHVVEGRDVVLTARVDGVKEFLVAFEDCRCPRFEAKPDENGIVRIEARLPEPGVVYTIHGVAFIQDKARYGWEGGYFEQRPAAAAPERYRVMATR